MADTPKPRGWQGTSSEARLKRMFDGHIHPSVKIEDRWVEDDDLSNPYCIDD